MTRNTPTTSDLDDYFTQGRLWVAAVQNSSDGQLKPRPVLIVGNALANDAVDVITNFITTQGARSDYDVLLEDWKAAGLTRPSWARTSKPLTLQKRNFNTQWLRETGGWRPKGYIGQLSSRDLAAVLTKCRELY